MTVDNRPMYRVILDMEAAHAAGRAAFDADAEIQANPYPDTSSEYMEWRNGWLAASDEFSARSGG